MCSFCGALVKCVWWFVHLSQGTLQRCLVGPPCMASRLGGGMGMQTMRTHLNRKQESHPTRNMTAPFQVRGTPISNLSSSHRFQIMQCRKGCIQFNTVIILTKHQCCKWNKVGLLSNDASGFVLDWNAVKMTIIQFYVNVQFCVFCITWQWPQDAYFMQNSIIKVFNIMVAMYYVTNQ